MRAHAWLLASVSLTTSHAAEIGSVCVHDYSAGLMCTGSAVSIVALNPVSVLESCAAGDPTTTEAVFDMRVAGGILSTQDIGLFMALNGDSALSGGNCFHDYLQPPLTTNPTYGDVDNNSRPDIKNGPWLNAEPFDFADDCGDIAGNTDVIKTLISLRVACTDRDDDGFVDVSTCTSWSAGTSSTCSGLTDAHPSANARCVCNVLNVGISVPGAGGRVSGLTVARSGPSDLLLAWSPSCAADDTDYAVYEGTLGDYSSHHSVACSTGATTSATIQPTIVNGYYLVVPRNAQREGSYGMNRSGLERPPATNACVQQLVANPCF